MYGKTKSAKYKRKNIKGALNIIKSNDYLQTHSNQANEREIQTI